jgi:hypothetical protein
MHSTSFNYGHPENQNLNTSNVRNAALQGQSPGGSQSFSGHAGHHPAHSHAASPDHEGGPGKRQAGGYSEAAALRPGSSHGGGAYAGAQMGSPDRRSASTSRGFQQQASTNYTLASPSTGERVAFYDEGRQVAGAASYRGGTTQNGADRMRLSAELGPRPGTSGGLQVSGSSSPAAYQGGRQASPAQSAGAGAYAGRLPKQEYPNFEQYASSAQQSTAGGGTMTVSRPRTSGGALSSSGGAAQGRSHSNGRSGLYKRRF